MMAYRFRPVTVPDLDLLAAWKREPHVAEWWDEDVTTAAELLDPRVSMRIVERDGRAFAFVQDYDVHGWEGHHLADLPRLSRGMDQFIGDPVMLGRGHGKALIFQRMTELFAGGAPALAVDPHPANARAIAVYRRVGFEPAGEARETRWGPVLPMVAWAPAAPRSS